MVDYYPVLLRAVSAPEGGDAQWRRGVYDHARQIVTKELRARRPPAQLDEVAAEQAALEAAIEKIEAKMSRREDPAIGRPEKASDPGVSAAEPSWIEPQQEPIMTPLRLIGPSMFVLPVIVAILGVGTYAYWAMTMDSSAPPTIKSEAPVAGAPSAAVRPTGIAKDGDLAPGIDGGSSDADLSYVFRRQPTFYRTLQPAGTIVIDKLQHFLYLIQPNSVALRYGIGLGEQCSDLAGLRRISSMAEWPQWQAPPDMVKRKVASAGTLPGGPGNPLGARVLELDDGNSRIHGTNAPKTIGNSVAFGCIRLVNDDIVDLYNRVQVSTPVVVN
jgi:lipoprotein-anchoring transpeptidase ErfK/SrfK